MGDVIRLDPTRPLACPRCGRKGCVVQVDTVEAIYPVQAVRRHRREVIVDPDEVGVDLNAIDRQFYRCGECKNEWPLEKGTRFVLPPGMKAEKES
jgi:DNA-directed RNA polymerase subunit RPC12/RpoP